MEWKNGVRLDYNTKLILTFLRVRKRMLKKTSIALLGMLIALALPTTAKAESVMERVSRTGILNIGTRVDTIPYAYVNNKEQLVGYSMDIIELIRQELETKLKRPITINVNVIPNQDELIGKVSKANLDLACTIQFTWQREEYVDFSLPYSLSGIRLLIKNKNKLTGTPESLVGKRIGVIPNSMGEVVMKVVQPKATLVPFKEVEAGLSALQSGKIDAIAGDTVVLAGNTLKANPENFALIPVEPYARYGVGCIVPENNSTFLNSVNRAIAKLMQGYIIGDQKSVNLVNRWLGKKGLVEIPETLIKSYFETIILSHEQIPLTPTSKAK
jgi:polar amino acid transport system substrate-binding protein